MEFGIFSNGFRPHTSAAQTYEEDIYGQCQSKSA